MMEKLIKKLNNRKGFTLIELIVVIAIIGILAAILIPQFTGFQDKARSTQATVEAKQVATAADAYYIENDTTSTPLTGITVGSDAMEEIAKVAGVPEGNIGAITYTSGVAVFTYTISGVGEAKRDANGDFTVKVL